MAGSHIFTEVVESLLAEGFRVRFRAEGRSMQPAVRDGECIVVAPVVARDVARDDVVLSETWRGPVAHRVVAITTTSDGARRFVLRGDASLECDRPVSSAEVLGRVVGVERAGRLRGVALPGRALGRLWLAAKRRARPVVAPVRDWLAPVRPVPTAG